MPFMDMGWCRPLLSLCLSGFWVLSPARAEVGVDVDASRATYHAVERFANGSTANTEAGTLEGAHVKAWWADGPLRLGMGLGRREGRVAYRGRTQRGFPIRTGTRITLDEATLDGRWTIVESANLRGALTAALGVRRIDREIGPTLLSSPLTEVLHWRFAQLGAQLRWDLADGWFVLADAAAERGLGARLAVDFHGVADAAHLVPGHEGIGHRVGFAVGREFGPGTTLSLRAGESRQVYGASPSKPFVRAGQVMGQVSYPGSVQRLNEVTLMLEMRWN